MGHRQGLTPSLPGASWRVPRSCIQGHLLLLGPLVAPQCVYGTQISYHPPGRHELRGISPVSQV